MDPHENSLGHFVHDVTHEVTHLDGKIFRTLWLLVRRPGLLTAEYWAGRRNLYIRPLRVYLVIATIHLIAMSANFYTVDFYRSADRTGRIERAIGAAAARRGVPPQVVEKEMNATIAKTYSVGQYFAVTAFALVPWLLYRKRRPHYLEHMIFSLHTYCFYFVLTSVASLFMTLKQWQSVPVLPFVTLLYMYFAIRRLYNERWPVAAAKAVALRAGLFLAELLVMAVALWTAVLLAMWH